MKIKYILICFNAFLALNCLAQNTSIKGRITDATTLEPVSFANIYFEGISTGTISDFDGYYEINSDKINDSISVSFVGYQTVKKAVEKGKVQTINFQLQPSSISLSEVIVVPGENPAVKILKKVWENKDLCNIDRLETYEFESYTKTQVYLRKLFNRKSGKDTSATGLFNTLSLIAEDGTMPALPVYMSETFSNVFYVKFPEREKVVVKATNTNSLADMETGMLTQLIQKSTKYNFNNNFVKILDKNFISPVSTVGLLYYKYYLMDSLYIDNRYCYEIMIIPKRKQDLVFSGTMWINDTTFALKRISVETDKSANLNFVDRIKIQQDYEAEASGAWFPQRTRILADAINIFISAYVINKQFISGNARSLSFYDTELFINDTADDVSEEKWVEIRPRELENTDVETVTKIDTLKDIGRVKILTALVNMSIKGFVNLGKIELGPYLLVYKYNEIEGNRFRMGFRTNNGFSERVMTKGFLAYGTNDRKFKFNIQQEIFLSRKYWTKAGVQYSEDVENLGAFDEFYSNSAFLAFASSFGGSDKMNSIKVGRIWFETDLFRGFNQKVVLKNKFYSPLSPDYFFEYYSNGAKTETRSNITVSELTFTSHYQPKATFIVDKNERFPVALKKSPAFTFNYTIGIKDFLNSDFQYHKASLVIKQVMHLGGLGVFSYETNLSKCFTPLPYPLLTLFPANESFFRSDRTFNLMKYGEFIADESIELFCTYRQDGFILDKLPLIKKLQLRSVATAALAYGTFDEKRNGTYNPATNPQGILPEYDTNGNKLTGFKMLDPNKPYIELSYGIENIFKIFRVDAIHRLSYLNEDENGEKPTKFGIKISAVFRF